VCIALRRKEGVPRADAVSVLLFVLVAGVVCGGVTKAQTRNVPTGGESGTVSNAGIPYRPHDDAGPTALVDSIRARRTNGRLLNLDRMLLHSPTFAEVWNAMFGAIRGQLSLAPKLRELSIMFIAVLNHADYEWAQHESAFIAAGGSPEQMDSIREPDSALDDSDVFDEAELATLALTYEMTRNVTVTDATMRRVRALLPDSEVVELVGTIAGYNMVSRFVVATGVAVE
jgi:alkylhydroperoxidase family enzyme